MNIVSCVVHKDRLQIAVDIRIDFKLLYVFKYDKHQGQFENVILIITADYDNDKNNYDPYTFSALSRFLSLIEIMLSLIAGIIRTTRVATSAIDKRGNMKSPASTCAFAP